MSMYVNAAAECAAKWFKVAKGAGTGRPIWFHTITGATTYVDPTKVCLNALWAAKQEGRPFNARFEGTSGYNLAWIVATEKRVKSENQE